MLAQQRGVIVNLSSIATRSINRVPYAAAKGGVNALTASLAFEYAGQGIRICATAPGGTEAPPRKVPRNTAPMSEQEKVWYQQIVDQTQQSTLMKRYGTLEEQAAPILFLASDEASYITGVRLPVGGGDLGSIRRQTDNDRYKGDDNGRTLDGSFYGHRHQRDGSEHEFPRAGGDDALIRHMHDFAREVNLTTEEYLAACDFMVRAGHMSDDKRNEVVLLTDVFGLESLADFITQEPRRGTRHRPSMRARIRQFWVRFGVKTPRVPYGASIVQGGPEGEFVLVQGRDSER